MGSNRGFVPGLCWCGGEIVPDGFGPGRPSCAEDINHSPPPSSATVAAMAAERMIVVCHAHPTERGVYAIDPDTAAAVADRLIAEAVAKVTAAAESRIAVLTTALFRACADAYSDPIAAMDKYIQDAEEEAQ